MEDILKLSIGQELEEKPAASNDKHTLSTSRYTVEFSDGPSNVYAFGLDGKKNWVCSAASPTIAMEIVEGLVLVEHKRFYYPQNQPEVKVAIGKPLPPFLKKK